MSTKSVKFSTPEKVSGPNVSHQIILPPKTPYPSKSTKTSIESTTISPSNDAPPKSSTSKLGIVHAETGQAEPTTTTPTSFIKTATPVIKRSSPIIKATVVAEKLRQDTNNDCFHHIRSVKYHVAVLHKHLLKIEEEIKMMSKGRRMLEIAIQDSRKSLSVNQQSLSTQQKRTRGNEDSMVLLLREEARTLSKCKRDLESHLQAIKNQLHALDNIRKLLKTKISSLSKSLQLDAQNFKLYSEPISGGSKQRQYDTRCQEPPSDGSGAVIHSQDVITEQLITQVNKALQSAKEKRGGIKQLVTSVHTRQTNAHKKMDTALSQSIEKAQAQKRNFAIEKGKLRLEQNSVGHEMHTIEITLGLVSGPISDLHKSVAERQDRPLSQIKRYSMNNETDPVKETKTKLTRQLSASQERKTSISSTEQSLTSKYHERAKSASFDSELLRVRRMSLDNRWVT